MEKTKYQLNTNRVKQDPTESTNPHGYARRMLRGVVLTLVVAAGMFAGKGLTAQEIYVTGTDLCSDGTQSTRIGLNDSDPAKMYAIYRDGKFTGVRSVNTERKPNPLDFGEFSETGKYTVVEFPMANLDIHHPEKGRALKGSVTINRMPDVKLPDQLEVKSGQALNFTPRVTIEGCTFTWTSRPGSGKVTGNKKSGNGPLTDTLLLQEATAASVIYTITPVSPAHLGSCKGTPRELVVRILP
jgi:hypothetical protein